MGHKVNPDREYRLLQERLDRNVTGAPYSPALIEILKLLCSPEDAAVARRVPTKPITSGRLARRLGMPVEELDAALTRLAEKGLVIDLENGGRRYYSLAPVVIGFFEFTFMRTGGDLPLGELAQLFDEYMMQDDRFARAVFTKETQVGRAMVREEALPEDNFTEILDWERATHAIRSASAIGLSTCCCRHEAEHLGKACDAPQETCLSFGNGSRSLVRQGFAREIGEEEALEVLARAKEAGLMQTGDNVKHGLSYLCNCCGCCCGMLKALRRFDIRNAIVTSNWIAAVGDEGCGGCGLCVPACPVGALYVEEDAGVEGRSRRRVVCDATLCLGCGICVAACPTGALSMQPRAQRVYTPENTFDRVVAMAIERGKLADLLFEDPELLSHRALGRVVSVLERTSPVQALLAIRPLRSAFFRAVVKGAGDIAG